MSGNAPAPVQFRLARISKRFGGTQALDGAGIELTGGEVHALLGENGSGKSTLMKIAAGLVRPDAGTVEIDGHLAAPTPTGAFRSAREATNAGVAIVHQELNLVPAMSAAENLFLGREPRTRLGLVDTATMRRKAAEVFDRLELTIDPRMLVGAMPVAMRQMVEVARAVSRPMRLLILDEPTSALGEAEIRVLFSAVRRLKTEGAAVAYISHKMGELFALADRYTVLRDGKTVTSGSMPEAVESSLVQAMVGRELADYYPPRPTPEPIVVPSGSSAVPPPTSSTRNIRSVILSISDLTRSAATTTRRPMVDHISLQVSAGEIVGIAGLVGAGRTELLEVLFGAASTPWTGTIQLRGRPFAPTSPADAIRAGVALVTEDRGALGLLRTQSVLSNATAARLSRLARLGILSPRREREALAVQSQTMRIRRANDAAPIESLSGGNQQKVILARWLMNDPILLLLDEPTRGIDVGAKAEIYRVLRALADSGVAILFASSELPEVLGLADRILVMSQGRITGEFTGGATTEAQLLEAAMPQEAAV